MSGKRAKPVSDKIQFKLKLNTSDYSKIYKKYMQKEYPLIQILIKKIVQMPFCRQYYLRYPLDRLLKGICKKLLINVYELVVFGYFLSEVEWRVDSYAYGAFFQVFPNIIHVNQPTDSEKLKQISMFLYFSSYSIKELLNQDVSIYRQQMIKVFPEFENIQNSWTSHQPTVGQILNLRVLNKFYQQASYIQTLADYNICVDTILQISPCYDIANKNDKKNQIPNFGFMQQPENNSNALNRSNFMGQGNQNVDEYNYLRNQQNDLNHEQLKISDIEDIVDSKFDGDI